MNDSVTSARRAPAAAPPVRHAQGLDGAARQRAAAMLRPPPRPAPEAEPEPPPARHRPPPLRAIDLELGRCPPSPRRISGAASLALHAGLGLLCVLSWPAQPQRPTAVPVKILA